MNDFLTGLADMMTSLKSFDAFIHTPLFVGIMVVLTILIVVHTIFIFKKRDLENPDNNNNFINTQDISIKVEGRTYRVSVNGDAFHTGFTKEKWEGIRSEIEKVAREVHTKAQEFQQQNTHTAEQEVSLHTQILLQLLASNEKEKQAAFQDIQKKDFETAKVRLQRLEEQQKKFRETITEQLVNTNLSLVALSKISNGEESRNLLEEAIALAPHNFQAINLYGLLLMRTGGLQEARDIYEYELEMLKEKISEHSDEEYKQDMLQKKEIILGNLGCVYKNLGEVSRAIEYYEDGLMISKETGNKRGEGSVLGNLGSIYKSLGETQKAIEYYGNALIISQEIGDRQEERSILGNLGSLFYRLGEVNKAIEYYEEALAVSRDVGDRKGEGNILGNLGSAYYRLDEVNKAMEYYEDALRILEEIESPKAVKIKENMKKIRSKK